MKTDIYRTFAQPNGFLFGSLFINGSQHTGLKSVCPQRPARTFLRGSSRIEPPSTAPSIDGDSTGVERTVSLIIIDFHACALIEPRFSAEVFLVQLVLLDETEV
jgi:hypothetical protein